MRKKKATALTAGILLMLGYHSALAEDLKPEELNEKINQLFLQNQQLTKQIAEMEKQLRMQRQSDGKAEEENNERGPSAIIGDYVTLSGAIEVEAGYAESFDGNDESSISLVTAELGIEAELTEWSLGVMALEWLDDEDKISVDEAFLRFGGTEAYPVFAQAGRYVVPFGLYDGNTISDPLTKEAFETKEDAAMFGVEFGGIIGSLYVFNGDTNEDGGDDHIEHVGAHVGYTVDADSFTLDLGGGYITSVFDSDGLSEYDADVLEADYIGGIAVNAGLRFGGFVFLAEYITALDEYDAATGEEVEPTAFHLEAGYGVFFGKYPTLFTLGYSQTSDLGGFLPESRFAAVVGVEVTDGFGITAEYTLDDDYDVDEGGTGENANAFTLQLAYAF